jgi:non-canonical purine NTP pyrophosphatase (RdgB/HAM1 family)
MKLTFITGNKGKFEEASKIIPELEQKDIDLAEIQSLDPKQIIQAKLNEAKKEIQGNLVVEDGGLYIESLNGLPGPLIKWFMKALGNEGLYKVLENSENKKAEAKVIVGVSFENEITEFFEGSVSGLIVAPRGDNGFGWDKIFQPEGYNKTFAEMTIEEKNETSMRKIAFQKLKDYLEKLT